MFMVALVSQAEATSPGFPSDNIYIKTEADCPQGRISVAWHQHWIAAPDPGRNHDGPVFAGRQISLDSVEVQIDGYRLPDETDQELLRFLRNVVALSSFDEAIAEKNYKISAMSFQCQLDGRPGDLFFSFEIGGREIGSAAVDLVALNRQIRSGNVPPAYKTLTLKPLKPGVLRAQGPWEIAPGWGFWYDAWVLDPRREALRAAASSDKAAPLVKFTPPRGPAKK